MLANVRKSFQKNRFNIFLSYEYKTYQLLFSGSHIVDLICSQIVKIVSHSISKYNESRPHASQWVTLSLMKIPVSILSNQPDDDDDVCFDCLIWMCMPILPLLLQLKCYSKQLMAVKLHNLHNNAVKCKSNSVNGRLLTVDNKNVYYSN